MESIAHLAFSDTKQLFSDKGAQKRKRISRVGRCLLRRPDGFYEPLFNQQIFSNCAAKLFNHAGTKVKFGDEFFLNEKSNFLGQQSVLRRCQVDAGIKWVNIANLYPLK